MQATVNMKLHINNSVIIKQMMICIYKTFFFKIMWVCNQLLYVGYAKDCACLHCYFQF